MTPHTLSFSESFILFCAVTKRFLFAIFTKVFAVSEGLMPEDKKLNRFFEVINLERGLIISGLTLLIGVFLLLVAVNQWMKKDFGLLDYSETMYRNGICD